MKVLSVFLVALFVTIAHQQGMQQTLIEWRKLVAPHMSRCMCQSNGNPDHVEAFFQFGEISNDPCFKCNVKCWAEGVGVFSTTGNINTTIYRTVYGITDEAVRKCGYNTHVDICQKAHDLVTCSLNMVAAGLARNSNTLTTVAPLPPSQSKLWEMYSQLFYRKN